MRALKGTIIFLWQIAKIVIISLVIIVPIRYFVVQPFFVRGESMHPTFASGDYLVINEIGYRFREPQRGDVVVFRPPSNGRQFYIKRVIGLPGEVVQVEGGKVWVGKASDALGQLTEEYITGPTPGSANISLGFDEYFVLGDNRNASSDSRSWGTLPRKNIIGKAWIRAWPIHEFEVVARPGY